MALLLPLAGVLLMVLAMVYSRFIAKPLGRRQGIPKILYKLPCLVILIAELVLSYRVWAGVELSPSPFYFFSGGGWGAAVSGDGLKNALHDLNPSIPRFDCSCFDGDYVTGDITEEYLARLDAARAKPAPQKDDAEEGEGTQPMC